MKAGWGGCAATIAIALLALTGCGDPGHEEREAPGPSDDPVVLLGPTEVVRGVPRGWRHDEQGARAAAVAYVGLTGDIVRAGFITRRDLIRTLAAPAFVDDLGAETEAQLRETMEYLADEGLTSADLLFSELPLTARVVRFDDGSARIEVWSVAIVGAPVPDTVPHQGWRTVTVDLGWIDGDWLVTDWAARPGPVPAPRPAATFDDLEGLEDVTSWPAATERED